MKPVKPECYALTDPTIDGPLNQIYRGASKYGGEVRLREHLYKAKRDGQEALYRRLRELTSQGLEIGLVILAQVPLQDLGDEELRVIDEGIRLGHPLLNLKRQLWHPRPPHGIDTSRFDYKSRLKTRNQSQLESQRVVYFRRRGKKDPLST